MDYLAVIYMTYFIMFKLFSWLSIIENIRVFSLIQAHLKESSNEFKIYLIWKKFQHNWKRFRSFIICLYNNYLFILSIFQWFSFLLIWSTNKKFPISIYRKKYSDKNVKHSFATMKNEKEKKFKLIILLKKSSIILEKIIDIFRI